jgi:hypothetical protein
VCAFSPGQGTAVVRILDLNGRCIYRFTVETIHGYMRLGDMPVLLAQGTYCIEIVWQGQTGMSGMSLQTTRKLFTIY